jgi:CHASE2 domain-containing sensor protein
MMAKREFWAYCKKTLRALIFILVIIQVLEHFEWFRNLDRAFLDSFARVKPPSVPKGIYIVEITDEDYKNLFHSTSPLDPTTVLKLIMAVKRSGAAVIGVDLDARDWDINSDDLPKEYKDELTDPSIVWAAVPNEIPENPDTGLDVDCPPVAKFGSQQIGLVLLPEDSDGVVRRHQRDFGRVTLQNCSDVEKNSPAHSHHLGSFDMVVESKCQLLDSCWKNLCDSCKKPPISIAERVAHYSRTTLPEEYINFSAGRSSFQKMPVACVFLSPCEDPDGKKNPELNKSSAPPVEVRELTVAQRELLKGSIVLIGGAYKAGRDEYWTPLGKMQGIELFANGIQAAAAGDYIVSDDWWPIYTLAILIDLMLGILIAAIYFVFPPRLWFVPVMITTIGLLIFPIFVYTFHRWNIWLGAAPIMASMIIEKLFEKYTDLKDKLTETRKELEEAKRLAFTDTKYTETQNLVKTADGTVREEVSKTIESFSEREEKAKQE